MYLINTSTLKVQEFFDADVPRYAILSHTWESEEITFQEMMTPTSATYNKKGYHKILSTCREASSYGLEWAWVDTCCIDKSSSAALSEAINSMFK
jgi:hypothetical protein